MQTDRFQVEQAALTTATCELADAAQAHHSVDCQNVSLPDYGIALRMTSLQMPRILLIENSSTQRYALSLVLHEAGYDVIECCDYWQAVNVLRSTPSEALSAIVLGWVAHEPELLSVVQHLLTNTTFKLLPQVILSEQPDEGIVSWQEAVPRSQQLHHTQTTELIQFLTDALTTEMEERCISPARGEAQPRSVHVLLVDDAVHDRVRFERVLRGAGYPVQSVEVERALETVLTDSFDILLIDYFSMDTPEGRLLFSEIGNNPPLLQLRRMVLIGAYNDRAVQDSLELGAVECVFKTETERLFLARINALASLIAVQKEAEAERQRFEAILGSVGEGVYGVDRSGKITFMNPAGRKLLGFQRSAEFIDKNARELIHRGGDRRGRDSRSHDVLAEAYRDGAELKQWETVFMRTSGRKMNVSCTVTPMKVDAERIGSVVAFRDITEKKRLERRLLWQATRDPLTDLFNRRYFERSLAREVSKIQANPSERSALLYLDLDKFKYLNDTAGHDAGDRLLTETSQRLKECVRETDDVARLGGDEFAVVLREVTDEEATGIAEHIRSNLQEIAIITDEIRFKLSCSIGIAMIEPDLADKDVLANADIACSIAKRKGRNQWHLYSRQEDKDKESMSEEITWSARLTRALEEEGFRLMFQPILPVAEVDLDQLPNEPNRLWASLSHLPDHYEVLLRLDDGVREVISPRAFLPLAERFNLIQKIDLWVVEESIRMLESLHAVQRDASFSVNLSGTTLSSNDTLHRLNSMIRQARIPPHALIFEITETNAIQNTEVAHNFIESLRGRGWRFALDDFGTGFSSFSQVKRLPVDIVKIDGQFVQDMVIDNIDRHIVSAINQITQSLGLETVAEYVETPDTLRQLAEMGVDHVQGFYISQPLTNITERAASTTQMLRLVEPVAGA